jgi:Tfp pilus assembly protein PilV
MKPLSFSRLSPPPRAGLTLVEVTISLALSAMAIASIVSGYIFSAQQIEKSSCSTAGDLMAKQRLEQTRAAKWDRLADPPLDEVVSNNFPVQVFPLNVPQTGDAIQYATNTVTISTVSDDPPLKMIRVDCVWRFMSRPLFTNSKTAYRAPDQ